MTKTRLINAATKYSEPPAITRNFGCHGDQEIVTMVTSLTSGCFFCPDSNINIFKLQPLVTVVQPLSGLAAVFTVVLTTVVSHNHRLCEAWQVVFELVCLIGFCYLCI